MSETIPTIDAWNARLAPPTYDPNTSDSVRPEPGDCGCCLMPKCCPPRLECQSGVATVEFVGFINTGLSGSDSDHTRYLRNVAMTIGDSQTTTSTYWNGSEYVTYNSEVVTATHYHGVGQEYSQAFSGLLGGTGTGACIFSPSELTDVCPIGGQRVTNFYSVVNDGGTYYVFESHRETRVYSSAEGDETPAHIAWQAEADAWYLLYTDQAGFDAAHAAWVTATATYDAWAAARDAWVNEDPDNRNPEDYPEPEPPLPGDEPLPLPDEPTAYFGPCDIKCVITDTFWEWNYTTHSADETSTDTYTDYGDATFLGPSHLEDQYETPTTYAEFLVLANAWVDANRDIFFDLIDSASSDACVPGTDCYAERAEGADYDSITDRFFRYRWKLNKCCSLYSGLSWLEVYYSQDFLNWLASGGSGDAPDTPTPNVKSWEWTGVSRPAVCDESGSSTGLDPFDDPDTWSPWSLTVAVPNSDWGRVYIRDLYMTCYRSAYGTKPDFIPLYGTYDPSDLNEDGIPDSQQ